MSPLRIPNFEPRVPWLGPDLQTVRNLLRGPVLVPPGEGDRLLLPMLDGSGDRLVAHHFESATPREGAPLVVLVHGLGGSSDSAYMQMTGAHLLGLGYSVLRVNLRGAGESRPLCREQYHAGRTADLRAALATLPEARLRNGVVVVGYSLGGNMTLKYAAEYGGLRAVVSVSAPIDLAAASQRFLETRNAVYRRYLLDKMKRETLATPAPISEEERTLTKALRTILAFDERIVAPRNGYSGAADYYAKNNARQFLGDIDLPALLIHALDDPWIPAGAYTDYPWAKTPRLQPLLARSGGHVGFHGRGSRIPWHDRCLAIFLETV